MTITDNGSETEVIDIDLTKLTLSELEQVEVMIGDPEAAIITNGRVSGKALRALVTVVKRRGDPAFSFADTADIALSAVNVRLTEDPTTAVD